jgi:hypothetical protein
MQKMNQKDAPLLFPSSALTTKLSPTSNIATNSSSTKEIATLETTNIIEQIN